MELNINQLSQRLSMLEKSNRRWRNSALVLGIIAVSLVSIAAIPAIPDLIQAKRIELLNPQGDVVVSLTSEGNSGAINVNNGFKTNIFSMTGNSYGNGVMKVQNDAGKPVVSAGAFQNGGIITVTNNQGTTVFNTSPDRDGKGSISIYDNAGNLTWSPSPENK